MFITETKMKSELKKSLTVLFFKYDEIRKNAWNSYNPHSNNIELDASKYGRSQSAVNAMSLIELECNTALPGMSWHFTQSTSYIVQSFTKIASWLLQL